MTYFKLREYIGDLYSANLDRLANQNACYKKVALEYHVVNTVVR